MLTSKPQNEGTKLDYDKSPIKIEGMFLNSLIDPFKEPLSEPFQVVSSIKFIHGGFGISGLRAKP